MRILFCFYLLVAGLLGTAEARRKLRATSLVACMPGSKFVANNFDVEFNPDTRKLTYDLDIKTDISGNALAEIEVWAYGFKVISRELDMCSLTWKQFCPLVPANVEIKSSYEVDEEYAKQIPGLAYQVPDIDTHMRVYVKMKETGERVACLQATFANGKTVSQLGVRWVTAVVAVCGLLASAILSAFGNSNAASHISANTVSLFLYFQSVVVVNMEHVHFVPPIAAAWSENFIWSMGLIRLGFMQKIFRWYVQSTGGHPSLFLTSKHMSVLTQRALSFVSDMPFVGNILQKRSNVLYGNERTVIFRGIKRLAFRVGIETTAVVCTGLTFFVLFGFLLAGLILGFKYFVELSIRAGWIRGSRFHDFRMNWITILKGVLLRYIYLGFTQLTILCLWELFQRDSPAVIILAILFFLLSTAIMVWAAYRSIFFAKISLEEHQNPAAILYGDTNVLNKYGFLYTMYDAAHYWWSCIVLGYILLKSLFISLVQASGKTQALCIFLLDLAYLVALTKHKPYLDRSTNILNITISSVTVVNSFLFIFFSDLFGQPGSVSSIMGAVFFVLNAAFSLILLVIILVYVTLVVFSKNPDLRFKPAKDDRASFQRRSMIADMNEPAAKELLALASAAKAHNENWQTELHDRYAQQLLSASEDMSPEPDEDKSIEISEEPAKSKILTVTNMLKRKLSLNRNASTKSVNTTLSRRSKF